MERMAGTLTIREAATLYNIPPSTLSVWVKAGIIRRVEAGTRGKRSLIMEVDVVKASKHYAPGAGGGRGHRQRILEAIAADR